MSLPELTLQTRTTAVLGGTHQTKPTRLLPHRGGGGFSATCPPVAREKDSTSERHGHRLDATLIGVAQDVHRPTQWRCPHTISGELPAQSGCASPRSFRPQLPARTLRRSLEKPLHTRTAFVRFTLCVRRLRFLTHTNFSLPTSAGHLRPPLIRRASVPIGEASRNHALSPKGFYL